jgi:hypothetical protein
MRYLFGDSTPFPLPFDFLRTLEVFMIEGTKVVLLEHRVEALAEDSRTAQNERARGFEPLAELHQKVQRALSGVTAEHPYAIEYKKRMTDYASSLMQEKRREVKDASDAEEAQLRSERERTNEEIGAHLRELFRASRLPTLGTRLSTALVDGRPDARAVLVHPAGVGVSFTLNTSKAPSWNAPRKLSDLGLRGELNVAVKKSFFGGKVTREGLRIDDWLIGFAELDETSATIAVRKKLDQKDTIVFKLRREGSVFSADIDHPGDLNAAHVPSMADPADLPHLDRMWIALAAAFDEIIEERAAITSISLDGEDVIERGTGKKLIERLISILAPTTLEIARRSPNSTELSLKREGDGGRREEVYLKRSDLLGMLEPLPRRGRSVFAPLGLEDWVPATTLRPPQVSEAEPYVEHVSAPQSQRQLGSEGEPRVELLSIDLEEG